MVRPTCEPQPLYFRYYYITEIEKYYILQDITKYKLLYNYMANENKKRVVNAIWENPARVFGCDFVRNGEYMANNRGGEYDESGKIRLRLTASGENITVFYNGGSRTEKTDVFTYLGEYVYNTRDFKTIITNAASAYNITLEYSEQERRKMARADLSREVLASLIEALRANPEGATAQYITKTRGFKIDGVHFGELTAESIKRAKDHLRNRGVSFTEQEFNGLFLTDEEIKKGTTAETLVKWGYNAVFPYYQNGVIRGYVLRNINPNADKAHRYKYSPDLGRGGYCDRLQSGQPAVMVEGQPDAIRLIQAGIKNVVAMGGQTISEDMARMLKAYNISEITYIPDTEYNEQGQRKTEITTKAINAILGAQVDGEHVVKTLYVFGVPTPEGASLNGLKIDADDYGKTVNPEALKEYIELDAVAWWDWELNRLLNWGVQVEETTGQAVNIGVFQNKFNDIYTRCNNPFERQRIKNHIKGKKVFEMFGITPRALEDVDEWNRAREYNNRINDAATALNKAVEEQASPVTIGKIIHELQEAQGANTREEWAKQLNQTFAEELEAIKQQPDTLKTKWEVGNITKTGQYVKYENIEFYPADICVFAAATSHGKTAVLFQAALDQIKATNKTFLYVSCEENNRQLLERALNVYLDIDTTPDGKTETVAAYGKPTGGYCFIEQTRKKTIKAVLRGDVAPFEYTTPTAYDEYNGHMGHSPHYNALADQVRAGVEAYGKHIRPRLKLIHTDATAESICSNIMYYVEDFRAQGVEIGGVFVDYMQLLTSENKSISRHGELKDICKALKDCAACTELPIIIAAQFNREVIRDGIDNITVAHIGEGADIERIAHDIFLVWQTDKTALNLYTSPQYGTNDNGKTNKNVVLGHKLDAAKMGIRSYRLFAKDNTDQYGNSELTLKGGCLYIEQMKARDGKTDGWGLFPFNGERGHIGINDKDLMAK